MSCVDGNGTISQFHVAATPHRERFQFGGCRASRRDAADAKIVTRGFQQHKARPRGRALQERSQLRDARVVQPIAMLGPVQSNRQQTAVVLVENIFAHLNPLGRDRCIECCGRRTMVEFHNRVHDALPFIEIQRDSATA